MSKTVDRDKKQFKNNTKNAINTNIDYNKTRYHTTLGEAYFFELCSNPNNYDKLLHYKLVNNKTIENTLIKLKSNEQEIYDLFGSINCTFHFTTSPMKCTQ